MNIKNIQDLTSDLKNLIKNLTKNLNREFQVKLFLAAISLVFFFAIWGVGKYRQYYENTHVRINNTNYRIDLTALDLSGQSIPELEGFKELTALETLNLQNTGLTLEQYEELHAALPDCVIDWSVPFQGELVPSTVTKLTITELCEEDLDLLAYFPVLKVLDARECRDYPLLLKLVECYPEVNTLYSVEIDGKVHAHTQSIFTFVDPDMKELTEKLAYLPLCKTVNLTGTLPSNEELLALQQAYPGITFIFDFEIFGITVNTLDEFIDLSGISIASTEEVDAVIPHFYNLKQIDMVNCNISNPDMDALNKRHPDVKIVWRVYVCGVPLRTDALHFMPYQYGCGGATGSMLNNLRYCTDMQVIDLGHYKTDNVDYVQYMPNLKCLLLCDALITDLTPIGNCLSLEYIELQGSPNLSNFWPLTNLSNLRDLNLSDVAYVDSTPLTQMPWLDRLWVSRNGLGQTSRNLLETALPNTIIIYWSSGYTTSGFRYTPHYFLQRDILGMWYSTN